jgi:hypothetical protein
MSKNGGLLALLLAGVAALIARWRLMKHKKAVRRLRRRSRLPD